MNVERGLKGSPQVTVSRAHADFVRKLFELEIPEIYEGLIEIKVFQETLVVELKLQFTQQMKYRSSWFLCGTKRN